MNSFPLRHVSVRVPWHDRGWIGTVCEAPQLNGSCAKLNRIAGHKDDQQEITFRGKSLEDIDQASWPPCVEERATFMAPFAMDQVKNHALAKTNKEHYGHFRPTLQRYPAYSAGVVPFKWLMRGNLDYYADALGLEVGIDREPDLGYHTNWVHEATNQTALLEAFAGHLRAEESLAIFYAKHVPFIEGTGRVIVGVGRVKQVGGVIPYAQEGAGLAGMVWERPIQHSIRPNETDGFLMPYQLLVERAAADPSIDLERYTAKTPEDHWDEFSFASELVTHDASIAALLSVDTALHRIQEDLGVDCASKREWLHTELVRLWKVRGPYPGLGAVLTALGLSRGVFIAHAIQEKAGENIDPWPLLDSTFKNPAAVLPVAMRPDVKELAPTWQGLPAERHAYLKLLSRFALTVEQAKLMYDSGSRNKKFSASTDAEILANPYRLYELTRQSPDGVKLLMVDRGVFPDDLVRLKHPLEAPSQLESSIDLRRVRAFTLAALETAALKGHTLLPYQHIVEAVQAYPASPPCPLTSDMLAARAKEMAPELVQVQMTGGQALQLDRYRQIGELVRQQALARVKGQRHKLERDWAKLLEGKFGKTNDAEELRARQEKAAALKELAEARFSVLAGPAGAGKTTVLGILCAQPEI